MAESMREAAHLRGTLGQHADALVVTFGSSISQARQQAKAKIRRINGDEVVDLKLTRCDEFDPAYKSLIR